MVNSGFAAFLNDSKVVLTAYPGLRLLQGNVPELVGSMTIYDKTGLAMDDYEVRIVATNAYPEAFPIVWETGGRIPHNMDWHVFETDGHCCICSLTDECLKTTGGLPLLSFMRDELQPFLFNQSYREAHGFFLQERPHGMEGQLEALQQLLGTPDPDNMSWLLGQAMAGYKMERTSKCFCGSKRKYRHCHRDVLERFKNMSLGKLQMLKNMVDSYRMGIRD